MPTKHGKFRARAAAIPNERERWVRAEAPDMEVRDHATSKTLSSAQHIKSGVGLCFSSARAGGCAQEPTVVVNPRAN
jgi:hypothetical protein